MIVNKKLDRFKQWSKEKMGGDRQTDTTDDFKALEVEMQLRQDGMERLNRSANTYIKHISRRDAGEEKEKQLPLAYFGGAMTQHGDDFDPDSEFGRCLTQLGRANERIARMQETYAANATSSWLESIERSLVQMKEYQAARKKLESRRLAYDTASTKMQKSKKEDFRMEEELRNQKQKHEESLEDVYRRMLDIKEAEADSISDLTSFLDAELTYYDRCREVLLQCKRDWPAQNYSQNRSDSPVNGGMQRHRSRASSLTQRFGGIAEDEPLEPPRPTISSRAPSGQNSPRRELPGLDFPSRPAQHRAVSHGFEGPTALGRESSPAGMPRISRVPAEPSSILGARSNLRVTKPRDNHYGGASGNGDVFADEHDMDDGQSVAGSEMSRITSWSNSAQVEGRKAPPPPPPSRSKKPPPPPPIKRSALSTSEIPHY